MVQGANSIVYEDNSGAAFTSTDADGSVLTTAAAGGLYSDLVASSDLGQGQLTETGDWTTNTGAGFNDNYLSVAPPGSGAGTGSNALSWSFGNLGSGTYQIYVSYPSSSANTSAAQFTVSDGGTALIDQPGPVDEQSTPSDLTIGSTSFASLGTFEIDSGTLNLALRTSA